MTTPNMQEALERIMMQVASRGVHPDDAAEVDAAFATIRQACEQSCPEEVIKTLRAQEIRIQALATESGLLRLDRNGLESDNAALTQERDTLKAKLDAAPHHPKCNSVETTSYPCNCWKSREE